MPPAVAAAAASARKAAAERLEQERREAEEDAQRAEKLKRDFELESERLKNSPRKVSHCPCAAAVCSASAWMMSLPHDLY
jgi:hypothetical protein